MRRRPFLLLSTLALASGGLAFGAGAQTRLEVEARPVAVIVYPDQAAVTRRGVVELPAGDRVLILRDVPAGILPDSVNARGQGAGAVAIGSVDLRPRVEGAPDAGPRGNDLRRRIRETEDAIAELDIRLAAFGAEQSFVERLAGAAAEARPAPAGTAPAQRLADNPGGWAEARTAVREGLAAAAEGARRIRLEKRPLEERLAALQAELRAATPAPPRPGQPVAQEIAVAVSAAAPTRFEIGVTYQVRGAGWRLVYEARLDSGAGRLELRQEAAIRQSTGEDWAGVSLTLSTARPSAGVQPPALQPWRIALQSVAPATPRGDAAYRGAAGMLPPPAPAPSSAPITMAPPEQPATPPPVEATRAGATIAAAGLSVQYVIPGTADLRADGTERRVRIADHPVEVRLAGRTTPRLEPRSYLEARFNSPAREPLLPGPVALHLDGAFIGRADLALLRPGEPVTLPFGADDRVRVVYEPQEQGRRETGGFLSGRRVVRSAEGLMTVTSQHTRPIEITVLDAAPVSGDSELVVAVTADPTPTARDVEDRPGVTAWTATYAPGEARRIRFGWQATAPEGRVITGLPR
ncbi:mucoidy inhibitor MuiA family protein [Muricoccus radiodurans]|uniref:mucoidy inhibitor MuiA family protein n=1 Tax=Muricoccus radiodurans TaxID=2231721 RepID=UPI003CE96B46